jgi:hypothetical protein
VVPLKHIFWRERCGRISGGTRVLELAADGREAALEKGAHSTSTNAPHIEHAHPWECISTQIARRTAAARGAARSGSVDIRSIAAGKPCTEVFG